MTALPYNVLQRPVGEPGHREAEEAVCR